MTTPVVVSCSEKYKWCLKPFEYLFYKYCGESFQVALSDTPKDRWVEGLLSFLSTYHPSHFVLLLEDYWLSRDVDTEGIDILTEFMKSRPDILRMDLTADRLYAGGMGDVCYYKRFDIVEAPNSQYQMSLQAGIWNKKLLIEILEKLSPNHRSAWNVELDGTGFVNSSAMKVYGTRQNLIRYANAKNNGRPDEVNLSGLSEEDKQTINKIIKP